jgi:hypothetical protein
MKCALCPAPAIIRAAWGPVRQQQGEFCRSCIRQVWEFLGKFPLAKERFVLEYVHDPRLN